MNPFQTHEQFRERRGVVAVVVVVMLTTLLMFGALAVDVGYICALTAEMQNTADAGALAGASALRAGVYDEWDDRAYSVISMNQEHQGFQSLDTQTVELGRWDKPTMTFTAMDPTLAASANAVRVVSRRNDVSLFFAPIIGHNATDVAREAVALVTPSCAGLWGLSDVTVPGSVSIDSFNSTGGDYDAMAANADGDLCSNGTITVQGNATIEGDVLAIEVVLNGGSMDISGVSEEADLAVTADAVDFGDVATVNDNALIPLTDNGAVAFNAADKFLKIPANDNLTLPAGTYYMKNITFDSPSTLSIAGPVTIYMYGDFDASGSGTINTTMNPADFTIMSSGTTVTIQGQVSFYGTIYAPNATVLLRGNADYYGAILADSIDFGGNFSFHLDESINLVDSLRGPVVLVK